MAAGPPPDPVQQSPVEACGLDLEAIGTHKWHVGGAAVWIGEGQSVTVLVTWVPQAKAAGLLVSIVYVIAGECEVSAYRSFVCPLQTRCAQPEAGNTA